MWAAVILTTTLLPSSSMPATDFIWQLISFDSLAHAVMFTVLVFLMIVGLKKQFTFPNLRHVAIRASFFISTAFGVGIELLQHNLIAGRQGDIFDVLSNTVGCLFGIVLFKWVYQM